VRTAKFLYIKNFRPDRWPAGDPEVHYAVGPFGDIDDGPCKQEIIQMGKGKYFDLCCGKRLAEELYDLTKDPWEIKNVANDPAYKEIRMQMAAELDRWMRATDDPRAEANGGDDRWDKYKYYGGPVKK
jgi:N-sulfoglucosamine sulfohydrolase